MANIVINGAGFYYEIHGEGSQPVVLISGYSGTCATWMPVVSDLAKHFKVLIFDSRGCGQTKDDGAPLSVELMADDVMALCRALDLKKPHIIGRSMGGTITQLIAAKYSHEISKIGILVSTAKWRKAVLMAFELGIDMQEQGINQEIVATHFETWLLGEDSLQDQFFMHDFKQAVINNPNPQSLNDQKRQFEVLKHFDGHGLLDKIHVPAIVIYGKYDIIALPMESIYLAANIKHAKLVGLDCGHMIAIEATDHLANELISFLKL